MRGITVTSICVTIAAAGFLALDITGAGDRWNARIQVGDHDLTIIAAIAAVVLWLVRWRAARDHDKTLLIRTLADAVPERSVKRTRPFPRAL